MKQYYNPEEFRSNAKIIGKLISNELEVALANAYEQTYNGYNVDEVKEKWNN